MKRKKLWLLPIILAAAVILVLALRGFPGGKGADPAAAPSEQDGSPAQTGPEETELPLDDTPLTPASEQDAEESEAELSGASAEQPSEAELGPETDAGEPSGQEEISDELFEGLEENELPIIPG